MPATDLELLVDAAKEAGRIATGYSGHRAKSWDKPEGAGPVTEADLAVNDMAEETLLKARPDYGWLSEESEFDNDRATRSHCFIIDPIDGTRSFIEGAPTWAHSIAVAENGHVTAAVVYLPKLDRMYTAAYGQGAFLNGERISVSACKSLDAANVLAPRPALDPKHWISPPQFTRFHRPSLAYRLSLVAEGRFDAMLTLRPTWEWDIAAGTLILQEAGARATDRRGQTLVFNSSATKLDGMVASNPVLHDQIITSLA